MTDPFGAALVAASVLALWDYGRRWLQIRETEAGASRNYEKAYQLMRDEVNRTDERTDQALACCAKLESQRDKADLEDFRNLAYLVSNHTMSLDAYQAAHEGLRAEMERRLDTLKADPETEAAIKELYARCDKNSTAIVNTAESMQKVLNEKFTALALSRGINQKG